MAVFRDTGHAQRHQPRRLRRQRPTQQLHPALGGRAGAAKQFGQCHLAIARDTGNRHDLARVQAQAGVQQALASWRRAHVVQHAHGAAYGLCRAALRRIDRMAHHPQRELGLVGVGRLGLGYQPAGAQYRDALGHPQHLAELVADKNDRQALRHHLAQHRKQRLALLRRQHRCGLVQDQDTRAPVQGFENLHTLAFAN